MRLTREERAARRAAFAAMGVAEKADYLFSYYKLPLALGLITVVVAVSVLTQVLTHRDAVLYVAFANVVPSLAAETALTSGYLDEAGIDASTSEVVAYRELYLSADASLAEHEYAYASRLKLMAAIEDHQLDVLVMNREAYDLVSASGYLLDLSGHFTGSARLCSNTVVIESNEVEVQLDEADTYVATTEELPNALEVTDSPTLQGFSTGEPVYLGVIANSERTSRALDYLAYAAAMPERHLTEPRQAVPSA